MEVGTTIPNANQFRLCFVDGKKAYFTDADEFSSLNHDDWDDGYDSPSLYGVDDPHKLISVFYDGPFEEANIENHLKISTKKN